jgi:hypothetical protein
MPQCEYITSTGPCPADAEVGRFCTTHSPKGNATVINQYRIATAQLRDTALRHAEGNNLKDLKGEIVILRSLLETRLNMIDSDAELVAAMPTLKDYAQTIEKVIASCHAMDVKLANLLNKSALIQVAQDIIGIMEENLRPLVDTTPSTETVDETIEKIGRSIVESIAKQENSK